MGEFDIIVAKWKLIFGVEAAVESKKNRRSSVHSGLGATVSPKGEWRCLKVVRRRTLTARSYMNGISFHPTRLANNLQQTMNMATSTTFSHRVLVGGRTHRGP